MAKTRDNYQVVGNTPEELVRSLNFLFQRLADRMDRIEGIRGTASIESNLDMRSNRVTDLGAAASGTDGLRKDQADLTGSDPSLGNVSVTRISVDGDIFIYGPDGNLIHSLE